MKSEKGKIVYRCKVKTVKGEVTPEAVLVRVLLPVKLAIGRRYFVLYPQRVVEGRFPEKIPPD